MAADVTGNHPPCAGGCGQLADECDCPTPSPLGSIRIEENL